MFSTDIHALWHIFWPYNFYPKNLRSPHITLRPLYLVTSFSSPQLLFPIRKSVFMAADVSYLFSISFFTLISITLVLNSSDQHPSLFLYILMLTECSYLY